MGVFLQLGKAVDPKEDIRAGPGLEKQEGPDSLTARIMFNWYFGGWIRRMKWSLRR